MRPFNENVTDPNGSGVARSRKQREMDNVSFLGKPSLITISTTIRALAERLLALIRCPNKQHLLDLKCFGSDLWGFNQKYRKGKSFRTSATQDKVWMKRNRTLGYNAFEKIPKSLISIFSIFNEAPVLTTFLTM